MFQQKGKNLQKFHRNRSVVYPNKFHPVLEHLKMVVSPQTRKSCLSKTLESLEIINYKTE